MLIQAEVKEQITESYDIESFIQYFQPYAYTWASSYSQYWEYYKNSMEDLYLEQSFTTEIPTIQVHNNITTYVGTIMVCVLMRYQTSNPDIPVRVLVQRI